MKKFKLLFVLIIISIASGCVNKNSMENIDIYTSAYPIEYVTSRLYSNHSQISSIYPNDMDKDYIVSKKLLKDYSSTNLFIFNGNEDKENEYMQTMFEHNKNLKIIDATASLTYTNDIEELWLDPMNLLTIANNIKKGFQEYTDIAYLLKDIDNEYKNLKMELIQLDADYREMANRSNKKQLIVGDDLFLYLNKYGLDVISLEDNDNLSQKTLHNAEELIKNGDIKFIYIKKGSKLNKHLQTLKDTYNVQIVELDTLYTLTENDRKNNNNYFTIMYNNLESLKQQLYS